MEQSLTRVLANAAALLGGFRGHDLDAGNVHPLDRTVTRLSGCCGNLFQHVVALDQLAERRVLAVQKTWVAVADKKLRTSGVWIVRARHREHAAHVGPVVELGLDGVARPARAPATFVRLILCEGIAALNHK